jgi:phage/plasmid-associated DNA primase
MPTKLEAAREKFKKEAESAPPTKEDEITKGLRDYFGEEFDKMVKSYGLPMEMGRYGWVLNDTFWGSACFLKRTILFSPGLNDFYEYSPSTGLWTTITEEKLTSQLGDLLAKINEKVFRRASTGIGKNNNEKFRHAAIKSQRGLEEIENGTAFLNRRRKHIQVANGVIVFENGQAVLKPFSSHYHSLYASPLAYNSEARCPKFEAEMGHLPPDDRKLIQRMGGLFLLGWNDAEEIFLFEGKGNSRKSTITGVFKLVLGAGVVTELRTKLLDSRFELGRLYDKSLLIGSDVDREFMLEPGTAVLKKLTGHDHLTGEKKGSNQLFDFDGELNVLITSNSELLLRLQTDADAWMRRIVLILFPSIPNPPVQQRNYYKRLYQEEGEGILRFMIDGANIVLQDFAENRGFPLTSEQDQRVNNRIEESDALNVFIKSHIEQTGDIHDGIPTDDVMFEYGKFCRTKEWKHSQINAQQLKDAMIEFGGEYSNKVVGGMNFGVRGYRGVRWKSFPTTSLEFPKSPDFP